MTDGLRPYVVGVYRVLSSGVKCKCWAPFMSSSDMNNVIFRIFVLSTVICCHSFLSPDVPLPF